MTELIKTLQNYKQILRDHQKELARELLSAKSTASNFNGAVTSASEFRILQNGINAVDEALISLHVLHP